MTRGKFVVQRIEISKMKGKVRTQDGTAYLKDEKGYEVYRDREMRTIVLNPVYSNGNLNHENSKFWDASPTGEIKLGTVNPEAWAIFEIGKEYYVDFTPANQ